ncbi:MAG: hypothetical protein WA949_20245 [Phormidesmis sp.]
MHKLLIRLMVVGVVSFLATALNVSKAQAQQACFVSEQTIETGPTLVPVSERRQIVVEDWRIAFAIPETYELSRDGLRMDILPPENYQSDSCGTAQSRSVSVSIVNRVISESDIRSRLAFTPGTYLGMTSIPSGDAFMHTTRTPGNQVYLSIPFPNQPVSVVFAAHADSNGEIFQEGILETVLETFQFRD